MKRVRLVGVPIVLFGMVWFAAMGLAVTVLWNLLMPAIFGLPIIGFWQALGLFVLARVLFGRFGSPGHRIAKSRFAHGWRDLTPEERQRFRSAMGWRRPPAPDEVTPDPGN